MSRVTFGVTTANAVYPFWKGKTSGGRLIAARRFNAG